MIPFRICKKFCVLSKAPFVLLFLLAFLEQSIAQPAPKLSLNGNHSINTDDRNRLVPESKSRVNVTADDLKLDTVEGVLSDNQFRNQLLLDYRGLSYLSYIRDDFRFLDPSTADDNSSMAQKLAIYQCAQSFTRYLIQSPLEPLYREVVQTVKEVGNYTSFSVEKKPHGSLGVARGVGKDDDIMRFRLHASVRNGIEPRLLLGKSFVVRYDPLKQDAFLQYEKNF